MAIPVQMQYTADQEERVRGFYQTLSEKDRRRYAALEARRLGRGGIRYVAEVVGCSRRTIERAGAEVAELPVDPAAGRVRRSGAGRKKKAPAIPFSSRI